MAFTAPFGGLKFVNFPQLEARCTPDLQDLKVGGGGVGGWEIGGWWWLGGWGFCLKKIPGFQ